MTLPDKSRTAVVCGAVAMPWDHLVCDRETGHSGKHIAFTKHKAVAFDKTTGDAIGLTPPMQRPSEREPCTRNTLHPNDTAAGLLTKCSREKEEN